MPSTASDFGWRIRYSCMISALALLGKVRRSHERGEGNHEESQLGYLLNRPKAIARITCDSPLKIPRREYGRPGVWTLRRHFHERTANPRSTRSRTTG